MGLLRRKPPGPIKGPPRVLWYACPDCDFVERTITEYPKDLPTPPPAEETIPCTCDACFSKRLDKIYPGARPRMVARLKREAEIEAARQDGPR